MRGSIPASLQSEFTDWVIHLMVDVGFMDPQLGLLVAMTPGIDIARMSSALVQTVDVEPVLGCVYVRDSKRPYWQRIDDLQEAQLVHRIETDRPVRDGLTWLSEPLDPESGAQIRALICKSSVESVLALKFSHVAVDASAMKEVAYQVATAYRKLGEDPEAVPVPNVDGERSVLLAAKGASLGQRLRALRPDDPFPTTEWGMPKTLDSDKGDPVYVTRHLGRDSFRPIRDWGRARGATVNDLVLTAYYRTLVDVLEPSKGSSTPVQLSCDFRRWLPEGTQLAAGNISGTWCISEGLETEATFEETLAAVTARTDKWKSSDAGVRAALGLSAAKRVPYATAAGRILKQAQRFTGDVGYPSLTNIGVLDEERLDFGAGVSIADAFAVGPIGSPPGFVLSVSTFREEMTLSAGFHTGELDPGVADRVLDGVVARLELLRNLS